MLTVQAMTDLDGFDRNALNTKESMGDDVIPAGEAAAADGGDPASGQHAEVGDPDDDGDDREGVRAAAGKAKKLLADVKKPKSKGWVVNKLLETNRYADLVDDDAEKAAEAFVLAKREGMIAETADGFVPGSK